jgi:signal transduction histidine kinase
LREQGLVAALESQTPLEADGVGRYDPEVEAAVYFCCLEALQNVAKYAPEAPLRVRLAEREGRLEFSVEDEGPGFDPEHVSAGAGLRNMRDRIAAAGGELEVISAPGQGTSVRGRLPARPAQPAGSAA